MAKKPAPRKPAKTTAAAKSAKNAKAAKATKPAKAMKPAKATRPAKALKATKAARPTASAKPPAKPSAKKAPARGATKTTKPTKTVAPAKVAKVKKIAPKPKAAANKTVASKKPKAAPTTSPTAASVSPAKLVAPAPSAPAPVAPEPSTPGMAFAIEAARTLADDKCTEVTLLDVRGVYQECDYILIGTGTSDRQMRSSGDDVARLGQAMGFKVMRREADERTTWLLLDFVELMVHLFEPNTRAHYDLEMLWGDAPRIEWARPPGARPVLASSHAQG
jgi:ribosome-associated protein